MLGRQPGGQGADRVVEAVQRPYDPLRGPAGEQHTGHGEQTGAGQDERPAQGDVVRGDPHRGPQHHGAGHPGAGAHGTGEQPVGPGPGPQRSSGGDGLVAQCRVDEPGDGRVGGAQAARLHHRGAAGIDDHDGLAVQLGVAPHVGGERAGVVALGGLLGQPGETVEVGGARRDELLGALRRGDGQQRDGEAGHGEDREGQDHGEDAGAHEQGLP